MIGQSHDVRMMVARWPRCVDTHKRLLSAIPQAKLVGPTTTASRRGNPRVGSERSSPDASSIDLGPWRVRRGRLRRLPDPVNTHLWAARQRAADQHRRCRRAVSQPQAVNGQNYNSRQIAPARSAAVWELGQEYARPACNPEHAEIRLGYRSWSWSQGHDSEPWFGGQTA